MSALANWDIGSALYTPKDEEDQVSGVIRTDMNNASPVYAWKEYNQANSIAFETDMWNQFNVWFPDLNMYDLESCSQSSTSGYHNGINYPESFNLLPYKDNMYRKNTNSPTIDGRSPAISEISGGSGPDSSASGSPPPSSSLSRSFQCPVCQKSITRWARFKDHLNSHNVTRYFACKGSCGKPDCDSVFSVKANLSRHCRSEEDRYTHCEICSKRILRQNISRHMRTMHDQN